MLVVVPTQGPKYLLEGQQALVDLCTLQSQYPVAVGRVRTPLTACKIDERDLPMAQARPVVTQMDVENGM